MDPYNNLSTAADDVIVREAALLEGRGDDGSRESAHLLWKEALKLKGLPTQGELTSHYYLGSYYFGKKLVSEGIKHYEKILQVDPILAFLKVGEANREKLIADFYLTLSTAYRSRARSIAKGYKGMQAAVKYLERKVNILGHMAAPSLLCELGTHYERCGDPEKEIRMLRLALKAPTHGSEFEGAAKKRAMACFQIEETGPLALGRDRTGRKPHWLKVALGGAAVAAVIFGFYMIAPETPKDIVAPREDGGGREREARVAVVEAEPAVPAEETGPTKPPAEPAPAEPVSAPADTGAAPAIRAVSPSASPAVGPIAAPPKDHQAEIRREIQEALRLLELRDRESAAPAGDPQAQGRADRTWEEATLRSLDAALVSLDNAMALASEASAEETKALIAAWKLRLAHARSRVSTSDSFSNQSSFLIQRAVAREIRSALAAAFY